MDNYTEVTERQLKISRWYLTHKESIKKWLKGFLIIVNVFFWSYSIYGMTRFYFVDQVDYQKMINELSANLINYQNYHTAHQPLSPRIISTKIFSLDQERYDIVTRVSNPNEKWLMEFDYQFVSEAITTESKKSFILPGEEKFIAVLGVESSRPIRNPRLDFKNITWRRFQDYSKLKEERFNFETTDIQFIPAKTLGIGGRVPVSRTSFNIVNKSAYNFWEVGVYIALYRGNALSAVNYITLREFLSNETRPVEMTWYEKLPNVNKVLVEPEANILDLKSFMSTEGGIGEIK